jgi:hypothetical protein
MHLYTLLESYRVYIIRMIKPRMMRWAGKMSQIGEIRNEHIILGRKQEGTIPLRTHGS